MDLQKRNSVLCSFLLYFLRPQGNMYLTDVSLAQEEHTDTGLSDTAADGVWKLLVQDGFLEWKLSSVIASGFCKLFVKCCLRLHGYPWRKAQGQCPVPDSIPEYHRLIPSHRSPGHVRRGAPHWTASCRPA